MASTYLTTSDILKLAAAANDLGGDVGMSEILNRAPLVAALPARAKSGVTFKYPVYDTEPSSGFRAENTGLDQSPSGDTTVTSTMKFLDCSFDVDVAVARADEFGEAACLARNGMRSLRAGFFNLESQLIYGTGNDALGFTAIAALDAIDSLGGDMCVDGGGSSANACTSVYALKFGLEDGCHLLWGADGELSVSDPTLIQKTASTKFYSSMLVEIGAYCGMVVGTKYSVGRIANLDVTSGNGLDDDLISALLDLFPEMPDVLVMSRQSRGQLQRSRTATNPTGAPAAFPDSAFNVPIITSEAVVNTESVLAATG